MTPNDEAEFGAVLMGLASIKPGNKLTPQGVEIFWAAMQDWTLPDFKAAAAELSRRIEFMPSPFHFDQLRKAGRLTAGEAWERARRASGSAIQCGQVTHNGTCGDPVIDRAVRAIGGYGVIAMCETSKLPFLERRFAEHLDSIQDADDTRKALPHIVDELDERPALALVRKALAK
jgi:hypothetical protein